MGNNSSSGLGPRGSRVNLNEGDDDARARSKKLTDDSSLGVVAEQPAAQQDAAEYDMPAWSDTGADGAELRRGSLGLAAGAAASGKATGMPPSSAPGPRRGSAPATVAPDTEGATAAEPGRRLFAWNKSKKKPKNDKKSQKDATASLPSEPDAAGAAGSAAAELQAAVTSGPWQQLQPHGRPQLVARSNSKESASKGSVAAGGVRVLPVPPAKPPAVRSGSAEKAGSKDAAAVEDEEDTYDHIQRDLPPSKVKSDMLVRPERPAGMSSGGGIGGKVSRLVPDAGALDRSSGSTYESVYPDGLMQSAAIKSGTPGKAASGPAVSQMVAAATADDAEDDEADAYDCIQRDVNPVREKQLRMQTDGVYGGSSGTSKGRQVAAGGIPHSPGSSGTGGSVQPLAASMSREGYPDRYDDGNDNGYDRIQHDVNPLKMKQGRPPPAVEYSLPQASHVVSFDASMAYETVDVCASGSASSTVAPASSLTPATAAVGGASLRTVPGARARAGVAGSTDDDQSDADGSTYVRTQGDPGASKAKLLKDRQQAIEDGYDSDDGQYATISASAAQPSGARHGSSGSASTDSAGKATTTSRPRAAPPPNPAAAATAASAPPSFGRQPAAVTAAAATALNGVQPARAGMLYSEVKPTNAAPRQPAATRVGAALMAARSPPPSVPPKQFSFSSSASDFDVSGTVIADEHGSLPANERRDHGSRTRGPALQAPIVDTSPTDADSDQHKNRVNQMPPYENVSVDPHRSDAVAESFDSRSACYANDQSLRGSQQPPMLTASPPLARSAAAGGAGRDRLKYAELAQPRSTAPAADRAPSQPHQPKLHPPNEAASMYSEIDFSVGAPAQPGGVATSSPTQQRQAAHVHSTQDGLLAHDAGRASPAQLSAPRKKPWVMQNAYQDIDDVREGLA